MKKLSFRTINSVMGKEQSPIQRQFSNKIKGLGRTKPIKLGNKPGNNDPCPCGSGRKFKQCCKS
ncbi:MAG: Protein translocase subunit SecA [candidate division TM6 bacterium GW2011_GWF2_33_332]|nr:MAG: Protein translocase subunit SecA [candidate division TM6 bacterium GW2011_GWF2_33_332]